MAQLAEIARKADVSMSTVSRVLNRRPGVSDETKARVLAAVANVPYARRGLGALGRTGMIGLLVPQLSNPVFPAFAEALETTASGAGYASVLCHTRSCAHREERYMRMLVERGIDGMVFVSPPAADRLQHFHALLDAGVTMVFVNGQTLSLDVPDVRIDVEVAGYLATRHLIELGHERIGYISGPARSAHCRLMGAGWTSALDEAGIPARPDLVAHAPFDAAGGSAAMARLFASAKPTAVICPSDHMALGAISEARSHGRTVPGDLSVIGFDDSPAACYSSPTLSTMAQPITEMAKVAIDELVNRLESSGTSTSATGTRVFRPRLVVRESTGPPRAIA